MAVNRAECVGLSYHDEKLFKMADLTRYLRIYSSEWAVMKGLQVKG
ncbi:MAG: hypothetical protein RO469_17645 [Thermincola sp.]|nr:hypothetical protein [Thermincola sp.]